MPERLHQLLPIALIVVIGRCLVVVVAGDFPNAFDELAHWSYVLHLLEHERLLAGFDQMRLVDPATPTAWTEIPNYLNHPPLYYWLASRVAWPFLGSPEALLLSARLFSMALAVGGIALMLWLGTRMVHGPAPEATYLTLVATTPTLPILGGIVSNESLAIFGGALCCTGVWRLLDRDRSAATWSLLALGLILASFAKLTAGLLCGALIVLAMAAAACGADRLRLGPGHLGLMLLIGGLAASPYLALTVAYGSPAPFTDGQVTLLATRMADEPLWRAERYDLVGYLFHFARSLLVYWPPAAPQTGVEVWLLAAPAACLAVALLGVGCAGLALLRGEHDPTAAFVVCGGLALALVMLVHLGFTYQRHLETGWQRGIYPRYYFALLPVLPIATAWLIARWSGTRAGAMLAVAVPALAIGYDVAYRVAAP